MLNITWYITPDETKKENEVLMEAVNGHHGGHEIYEENGDNVPIFNINDDNTRKSLRRRVTGTGLELLTKKDYMM